MIGLKALKTANQVPKVGQGGRHTPRSGWVCGLSGPPESSINAVIITLTQASCGIGEPDSGVRSGPSSGDEQLL